MQRSSNTAIDNYGNMMVADHTLAQSDLNATAGKHSVQLPSETDQEHKNMAAMLMMLQGDTFDSTYIYMMVAGHDKAIALHQDEINNGQSRDVKQYASDKLMKIQHHREMADSIAKALFP